MTPPPLHAAVVSTTELNHATAAVLARVSDGEHLAVTWHGLVVAQLVPASPHPLAPLVAAGLLQPAPRYAGFPSQPRRPAPVRP